VLNNRLTPYAESNGLIDERQIGFRKGARTTDHTFVIKTLFNKYCQHGNTPMYACFIDFQKAFDSVWHEALLIKLLRNGIGGLFYKIIKSMYLTACSCVKDKNGLSKSFPIGRGVKQGDVLSPLIFNMYLNDLIPDLNSDSVLTPKTDRQRHRLPSIC
jgi:hypothetical protein